MAAVCLHLLHNHMQMIALYRDPHGENIFEISKSTNANNATETNNASLRKKVIKLERELTQVGVIVCKCLRVMHAVG